jgi:hypothetical protein
MHPEREAAARERLLELAAAAVPAPLSATDARRMARHALLAGGARRKAVAERKTFGLALGAVAIVALLAVGVRLSSVDAGASERVAERPMPLTMRLPSQDARVAEPGAQFELLNAELHDRRIELRAGAIAFDVAPLSAGQRFVDDERVVRAQLAIAADVVELDAVGHDLDARGRRRLIREAHGQPDGLADARAELGREPARDGLRRNAARLRVTDHARDAAAGLETELRQLGRLAAARVAADDDDAVRSECREQLLARGGDRQGLRVFDAKPRRPPRGDDLVARAAHNRPARASSTRSSAPPSGERPTSSVPR